jgi:hypothetical protein
MDSDIVNYVNRKEVADERMKTIRRKRRSRRPTPSPPPHPGARLLGVGSRIQPIDKPLLLGAVDAKHANRDGGHGGPHSAVRGGAPEDPCAPAGEERASGDYQEDLNGELNMGMAN